VKQQKQKEAWETGGERSKSLSQVDGGVLGTQRQQGKERCD